MNPAIAILLSLCATGLADGMSVIIGRPTDRSVTLSVLSPTNARVRVEYGAAETSPRDLAAGVPAEFEVGGLTPDTRYTYRVGSVEGAFRTRRTQGSTFTFGVQGDSHPDRPGRMFDAGLYARTLDNVAGDAPDFHFLLGDDFSIERLIERQTLSQAAVDEVYARQRRFLGAVGRLAALFLVNGNHEQAALCNLGTTEANCAVFAGRARARFFPMPAPDGFYAGDTGQVQNVGLLRDYYAWTWGDALFAAVDFYWHSPGPVDNMAGSRAKGGPKGDGGRGDPWAATLGEEQYRWLSKTLEESRARWKFVFCHHVLGTGRGGIECAPFHEWGGKDHRGDRLFAEKRPGWPMPIHDLFVKTGVTIFFQGHDHLFARQELDGVIYQSCPNPADPTYQVFNRDAYRSGDILPNSGHLRVTVSPREVSVDYVRSWLAADETAGRRNGETAFHYVVRPRDMAQ